MAILSVGPTDAPPHIEFPAALLVNPKTSANVINVHRLAACFGVPQVWCTGSRVGQGLGHGRKTRLPPEERMRGFGRVDLIWCERALELFLAAGARTVAIELLPTASPLLEFTHESPDTPGTVYVFGPEDGSLEDETTSRCNAVVQIPSFHCLNLANAVSTVLWDRTYKGWRDHGAPAPIPTPENRTT